MTTRTSNREVILLTAWKLFIQRGYYATSIRDIALAVKLPKGSIYNYFESKEQLLQTGVARAARLIETELRQRILAGTLSPAQIVNHLFEFARKSSDANKFTSIDALSSLLTELAGIDASLAQHLIPVFTSWRAVIAQKIWAYATVARVPELIEKADQLAGLIQATLQGALAQASAQQSPAILVEIQQTLSSAIDSYVNALAAGDVDTGGS